MKNTNSKEKGFWLWVTKPKYYLDETGEERAELDPGYTNLNSWWTCSKYTKKGDLVLLWRTSPKSDIAYLIVAESDAYAIDHPVWNYWCDFRFLYKFKNPLTISEIKKNIYLSDWNALRARFQGRSFGFEAGDWARVNELLASNNRGYKTFLKSYKNRLVVKSIKREEDLEDELVKNLGLLNKCGYSLELWTEKGNPERNGRQLVCTGVGGRMDLLCKRTDKKGFVVIELKNVVATEKTFGQISSYMGWVKERLAKRVPVSGLIISRGCDARLQASMKTSKNIEQIDISEIGFK